MITLQQYGIKDFSKDKGLLFKTNQANPMKNCVTSLVSIGTHDDYIVEPKIDGSRVVLQYGIPYSRHGVRKTFTFNGCKDLKNYVLDGEYCKDTGTYFVFDCLATLDTGNIMSQPYIMRRNFARVACHLKDGVSFLNNVTGNPYDVWKEYKRYSHVEGFVIKNKWAEYNKPWFKVKFK